MQIPFFPTITAEMMPDDQHSADVAPNAMVAKQQGELGESK